MQLYVVGRVIEFGELPNQLPRWDLVGVFDSPEKADAACKDENYMVGPIELNFVTPETPTPWPDSVYPRRS